MLPKYTLSWQEPQASLPGCVFQSSPCGVALAASGVPSWQRVQLRTSCVKVTAEKSLLPTV